MIFKIALKNMFKNKKRTILTIFSITISSIFMFTFLFLFSSYKKNLYDKAVYDNGREHLIISNYKYSDLNSYKNNSEVKNIYPAIIKNIKSKEFYISSFYLFHVDNNYLNTLELTSGRLPKENEILIPSKDCLKYNNIKLNNINYNVVGCVNENRYYTYYKFNDDDTVSYLVNYNVIKDIREKTIKVFNPSDENEIIFNDSLLKFYTASTNPLDYYFSALLDVILLIGSTIIGVFALFIVYNAYSISIIERKKLYGILTTIGANKIQIVLSILIEALIEFIISFIFSFALSYLIIKISLNYVNINYLTDFKVYLYPSFFFISTTILLVFILLSSVMPAIEASLIDPIKAIKSSNDIKAKKIKEHKLIQKIFGVEGVLAYNNNKRNKRKFGSTTFSIIISFVLFVVVSIFTSLLGKDYSNFLYQQNYDYVITSSNVEELLKDLDKTYITNMNVIRSKDLFADSLDSKYYNKLVPESFYNKSGKLSFMVYNMLEEYSEYKSSDINFINNVLYYDYVDDSITDYYKGDIFSTDIKLNFCDMKYDYISEELVYNKCINIDNIKYIKDRPIGVLNGYSYYNLIVPDSIYQKLPGESTDYSIYLKVNNMTEFESSLIKLSSKYDFSVTNQFKLNKQELFNITISSFVSKSLMIFIIIISLTNIFNSINASMNLRKREFKMLESIGMDKKSFRKMIRCESLFFSLKSIIWGSVISITIYLWLKKIYKELFSLSDIEKFIFPLPLKYILIAIFATFIIVYVIMMISSKDKDDDIVSILGE